jgi:hypothetical protein
MKEEGDKEMDGPAELGGLNGNMGDTGYIIMSRLKGR